MSNGSHGLCQPDLGGIRPGYAFDNMHMNRLEGTALVKPEKDDIRSDIIALVSEKINIEAEFEKQCHPRLCMNRG